MNVKSPGCCISGTFYAFAPLRAMGAVDSTRACEVIEQVFSRTILRYHPSILEDYKQYGFDNRKIFVDFLNAQDGLCSYAVDKNLHCDAIEEFVFMQTRLSRELCKKMTDMIDKNFNELRMNYIIEKLNLLKDKF